MELRLARDSTCMYVSISYKHRSQFGRGEPGSRCTKSETLRPRRVSGSRGSRRLPPLWILQPTDYYSELVKQVRRLPYLSRWREDASGFESDQEVVMVVVWGNTGFGGFPVGDGVGEGVEQVRHRRMPCRFVFSDSIYLGSYSTSQRLVFSPVLCSVGTDPCCVTQVRLRLLVAIFVGDQTN